MQPTRSVRPFEVDQRVRAERRPAAGDRRAGAAHQRGRDRRRAARRDGNRQVGDDGLAHRAGAAPDARAGAQQDPRRAARERVPRAACRTTRSSTSSRYYDYYQPEAYVPQTDTFIEKDSSINAEVERLRHSTTNSLLSRRDVVVVSTVSCIYGLGAAEEYLEAMVALQVGERINRDALIRRFVSMQYERNDVDFSRGKFRVRGDTIEIIPVYEELAIRIEMFGDEIEALYSLHPLTGDVVADDGCGVGLPGDALRREPRDDAARDRHDQGRARGAARRARAAGQAARGAATAHAHDLRHRDDGADRLLQRHRELLAAHRRPCARASRRNCLLDYFPEDFLVVIDESHVTVPQIGAMYEGDASPQAHPRRARLPAAERARQPPAALGGVPRPRRAEGLPLGDAGQVRARHHRRRRRADHPPDRPRRPADRRQAEQGPDRRPARGDPRRAPSATSACSSRR